MKASGELLDFIEDNPVFVAVETFWFLFGINLVFLKFRIWVLPSAPRIRTEMLPNKCDEEEAIVGNQRLYKESSLISLSESWLNDNTHHNDNTPHCTEQPYEQIETGVRAERQGYYPVF